MQKGLGITVQDLSWSIKQKNQQILYPLSFKLKPRKILGVVGPNGAGKSTLLRLLYRFYRPTTGKINLMVLTYANWHCHKISRRNFFVWLLRRK